MKKKTKVILIIILVLLAGLYGVMLWQKDNITMLLSAMRYSSEDLEQQMKLNQEKTEEILTKNPGLTVRDLTDAEKKALADGSLSQEEAIRLIVGGASGAGANTSPSADQGTDDGNGGSPSENGGSGGTGTGDNRGGNGSENSGSGGSGSASGSAGNSVDGSSGDGSGSAGGGSGNGSGSSGGGSGNGGGSSGGGSGNGNGDSAGGHGSSGQEFGEKSYEDALSELLAEAYVLRASFEGQLSAIEASARAQYHALPKEERTPAAIMNVVTGFTGTLRSMEAQCDADMEQLFSEMTALIQDNHGDLSIVDTVRQSYQSEKELKKAWYLSQLQSKTG